MSRQIAIPPVASLAFPALAGTPGREWLGRARSPAGRPRAAMKAALTLLLLAPASPGLAAAPAPPAVTAEEALAAEQGGVRGVLEPICAGERDEIVVCGRRRPDRDRLPLRDARIGSLPGEAPSTVIAMKGMDVPPPQPLAPPPRRASNNLMRAAMLLLMVGEGLAGRERDPPPIPPD